MANGDDLGFVAAAKADDVGFVPAERKQKSGQIQIRKGGPVYANAAEAAAAERESERTGAEAAEHAIAGITPGGELGIGAIKGALSTGRGIGHLLTKTPILGKYLAAADPNMASGEAPEALKAHGLPQKLGFGGEQAAEFLIPGGAVGRGAKAAEGLVDAAKLTPTLGKIAKLGSRAALEGAATGAVNKAQGGDFTTSAVLGAGTPVAAAGLRMPAKFIADKVAPQIANKLLRPIPTVLENAARFGRNPGQAIADEGIIATSHANLVRKVVDVKERLGKQIGDALRTSKAKPMNVALHIQQPINDMIQAAADGKVEGGEALISRLQELRNQYMTKRVLQPDGSLKVMGPKRLTLTSEEMHGLKKQIGENTKWSGQAFDDEVNEVKRGMYRNLNEEIQKRVPGVKSLQDRYGNLLEAQKSAERELARQEARNPFSLTDYILGTGGALGGFLGHGNAEGALLGPGLMLLNKAERTPLSRTLETAAAKNAPRILGRRTLTGARNLILGTGSAEQQ